MGPGSYNLRGNPSKYALKKVSNLSTASPFIAGEKRFRNVSKGKLSPGPGSYKIKSAIRTINRKGKKTSFGNEEKRNSSFDIEKTAPGPGYYDGAINHTIEHQSKIKTQESRNAYGRIIPKSSSMFLSSVKKDPSYIKPLPWDPDYNIDSHTIESKVRNNLKSSILVPVHSLKKPDSRANLRGPGHYKIKSFLETVKPYRNSSAFFVKEERFKSLKEPSPGPCEYNTTISKSN